MQPPQNDTRELFVSTYLLTDFYLGRKYPAIIQTSCLIHTFKGVVANEMKKNCIHRQCFFSIYLSQMNGEKLPKVRFIVPKVGLAFNNP